MSKNRNIELENGVLTTQMNANTNEFKEFQELLKEKSESFSLKQKNEIELFSLQIKIEDYLNFHEDENNITPVGEFLRMYINKLNLKQNKLAKYIGLNPTNFNKILSGNRKVNFEISYMLSQIFNLDPKTWILIQVKNEYLALKKNKEKYFQQFNLDDLIRA